MKSVTEIRRDTIGDLICHYRERAGVTQKSLGKRLGYRSGQYVSNMERGITAPPMGVIKDIKEICNIPKSKFIAAYDEYLTAMKNIKLNTTRRHLH